MQGGLQGAESEPQDGEEAGPRALQPRYTCLCLEASYSPKDQRGPGATTAQYDAHPISWSNATEHDTPFYIPFCPLGTLYTPPLPLATPPHSFSLPIPLPPPLPCTHNSG